MGVIGGTVQFLSVLPQLFTDTWKEAGFQITLLLLAFLFNVPVMNFLAGRPLLENWIRKMGTQFAVTLVTLVVGAMFGMLWMSMIMGCG